MDWLLRLHLLALPPTCWSCRRLLPRHGRGAGVPPGYPYWCETCHDALPWFVEPRAEPLAGSIAGVERLWAACRYEPPVRDWVQRFKYSRRAGLVRLLAGLLHESPAGREPLRRADAIVPVPLHPWRLWQRGFNQSLLLAHAWRRGWRRGRQSGLQGPRESGPQSGPQSAEGQDPQEADAVPALEPRLLVRHRYTPPQARMSGAERHANVAHAFSLHPGLVRSGGAQPLQGRRVLLLDDVSTTGATLAACARVLREAGAARVEALVVARA